METIAEEEWFHTVPLALRDGVELLKGANDETLLFSAEDGHYTRLQPGAVKLLGSLNGTYTGADLVDRLTARDPSKAERVGPAVTRFLAELKAAEVLNVYPDDQQRRRPGRESRRSGLMLRLPIVRGLDRSLAPVAAALRTVPVRVLATVVLLVLGLAGGLTVLALLSAPLVPDPADVAWPALALLPLFVVIHEGSHAVVLAYLNVQVRSAGIGLMMYVIPVGYVDRTDAYRVRSKAGRVAIALAGPGTDLFFAGALSVVALAAEGTTQATAKTLVVFLTTALVFNLNPLLPTDGYHAAEAALGGLNARQRATSYLRHRLLRRPLPSTLDGVSGPRAVGYVLLAATGVAYPAFIVVAAAREVLG